MTEAKIRDLEARLATADVIDPRRLGSPGRVVFGSSVKIEDIDSGEQRVFSIFGAEESDVEKGWISFEAPLGRALIGKEIGDVVKVPLPTGAREYEVMEIFISYEETVEVSESAE
jgi:transcription elongation factor GreA